MLWLIPECGKSGTDSYHGPCYRRGNNPQATWQQNPNLSHCLLRRQHTMALSSLKDLTWDGRCIFWKRWLASQLFHWNLVLQEGDGHRDEMGRRRCPAHTRCQPPRASQLHTRPKCHRLCEPSLSFLHSRCGILGLSSDLPLSCMQSAIFSRQEKTNSHAVYLWVLGTNPSLEDMSSKQTW